MHRLDELALHEEGALMRPETRALVFDSTIEQVCERLDLSARAAVALVEAGLVAAELPVRHRAGAELSRARFCGDQVARLVGAEGELSRLRARHPASTRQYDRACALGALVAALR